MIQEEQNYQDSTDSLKRAPRVEFPKPDAKT